MASRMSGTVTWKKNSKRFAMLFSDIDLLQWYVNCFAILNFYSTCVVVLKNMPVCLLNIMVFLLKDTEFPGVVARPIGEFRSTADYQYQLLRCNVDLLKIIQVGLTFMDENGQTPSPISTWQFNFRYNLT